MARETVDSTTAATLGSGSGSGGGGGAMLSAAAIAAAGNGVTIVAQGPPSPATTSSALATPHMLTQMRELLEYYRARVCEFEAEHQDVIARLGVVAGDLEENHRTRLNSTALREEVERLKQQCTAERLRANEERRLRLLAEADKDALRLEELESRRRIQHLMALTKPNSQEITYFREHMPNRVALQQQQQQQQQLGGGALSVGNALAHQRAGTSGAARVAGGGAGAPSDRRPSSAGSVGGGNAGGNSGGERVLRSVLIDTEQQDALRLEVSALRAQLEEQSIQAQRQVATLHHEVHEVSERLARRESETRGELQRMMEKLHEAEQRVLDATRDYLMLKHQSLETQRLMKEDAEALRAQNQTLIDELQRCNWRLEMQHRSLTSAAAQASDAAYLASRDKLAEAQARVAELENALQASSIEHKQALARADTALQRVRERATRAEVAHKNQVAGMRADVRDLAGRVDKMERYVSLIAHDPFSKAADGAYNAVLQQIRVMKRELAAFGAD